LFSSWLRAVRLSIGQLGSVWISSMSILIRNTANIRNLYNSLKKISLAVYATKLPQYNPVDMGSITSYRRYSIRSSILPSPPRSLPRSVQYLSTQTSRVENTRKIPFPLADIGEGKSRWLLIVGNTTSDFMKRRYNRSRSIKMVCERRTTGETI